MKSNPELKSLYNDLNKQYFNNTLPDIPVLYRSQEYLQKKRWGNNTLGKKTAAVTLLHGGKPVAVILCKPKEDRYDSKKMDLLHEMVHVAYPHAECGENGKIFKKELRRLVRAGALDDIF